MQNSLFKIFIKRCPKAAAIFLYRYCKEGCACRPRINFKKSARKIMNLGNTLIASAKIFFRKFQINCIELEKTLFVIDSDDCFIIRWTRTPRSTLGSDWTFFVSTNLIHLLIISNSWVHQYLALRGIIMSPFLESKQTSHLHARKVKINQKIMIWCKK